MVVHLDGKVTGDYVLETPAARGRLSVVSSAFVFRRWNESKADDWIGDLAFSPGLAADAGVAAPARGTPL
jgi:hypothetical protein